MFVIGTGNRYDFRSFFFAILITISYVIFLRIWLLLLLLFSNLYFSTEPVTVEGTFISFIDLDKSKRIERIVQPLLLMHPHQY